MKTAIVVAGALANKPLNGGAAWTRMSWATGLRDLGFQVYFVEQIDSRNCVNERGALSEPAESINRHFFDAEVSRFGLRDAATLIVDDGQKWFGLALPELLDQCTGAACLLNVSGHLKFPPLWERIRHKVYLDLDPGYTQIWHDSGFDLGLENHDLLLTIGENIGTPGCAIPTTGLRWHPIRQPVLLTDWPLQTNPPRCGFTTISSWRGPYGPVTVDGRERGGKHHEFRRFWDLPHLSGGEFEIALQVVPGDESELHALRERGWSVVEPGQVAADSVAFRRYVQSSLAEFSVAQGVYVHSQSGWFSDRSVRYLASGRPVVLQDTGFRSHIPTGEGLHAFATMEEAKAAVAQVRKNYPSQSRAARELAENYFDSRIILGRFTQLAGLNP